MQAFTSTSRRTLGVAAGALAALASVLALATAPAGAAAPVCSASSLVVWLDTQGNGAAGSIYYNLEFTNLGRGACTLYGYPGVSAVDLSGRQLGSAARRDAVRPAATVTLAAGGSAYTVLRITEAGNYPGSACGMVTAAGLRVYPPGQTASKLVPYPFSACSRSGPNILSVETVRGGRGTLQ